MSLSLSYASSSNLNNMFIIIFLVTTSITTTSHIALAQNSPEDLLDVHNQARAEVGVGPLSWNETLAAYAQSYADKRIDDCEMEHSMGPYGENLAMAYENMDGTDAVKLWLTEKENYDPSSNTCKNDECLHYTQIVWRDTVQVGCGRSKCKNGWMFVICSYAPIGNIEGQRPY